METKQSVVVVGEECLRGISLLNGISFGDGRGQIIGQNSSGIACQPIPISGL
jgi:hypothetical protein